MFYLWFLFFFLQKLSAHCHLISLEQNPQLQEPLQKFQKAFETKGSAQPFLHALIKMREPIDLIEKSYEIFSLKKPSLHITNTFLLTGTGDLSWSKIGETCQSFQIYPLYGQKKQLVVLFSLKEKEDLYVMTTFWTENPLRLIYHNLVKWSYQGVTPENLASWLKNSTNPLEQYFLSKGLEGFDRANPYVQRFQNFWPSTLPQDLEEKHPKSIIRFQSGGLEFDSLGVLPSLSFEVPPKRLDLNQVNLTLALNASEQMQWCEKIKIKINQKTQIFQWFPRGLRCHYQVQGRELPEDLLDRFQSATLIQ